MATFHEFESARNLYEKLVRDGQRLQYEPSGDNFFTFITTVVHLQPWIKSLPISASETINRLLRKLSRHPYVKICKNITSAKVLFKIEVFNDGSAMLHIDNELIDVNSFRDELLHLFDKYFKQK